MLFNFDSSVFSEKVELYDVAQSIYLGFCIEVFTKIGNIYNIMNTLAQVSFFVQVIVGLVLFPI